MSDNLEFNKILTELKEFTFRTTLLSDKKIEVEFRPIQVKDQKTLIVNSDDESYANQIKALLQLFKSCVKKCSIQPENLYIQDFIWIIVNLRAKSIGEVINLIGTCLECHNKERITINIEKDIVPRYFDGYKNSLIEITPNLKLSLTLPKIKDLIKDKTDTPEIDLLADMIDIVEYEGNILTLSFNEKLDLLNNLDIKYLEKFELFTKSNDFGVSVPIKFKCSKCQKENGTDIRENILSFF